MTARVSQPATVRAQVHRFSGALTFFPSGAWMSVVRGVWVVRGDPPDASVNPRRVLAYETDAAAPTPPPDPDPAAVIRTCANCGAEMKERKRKLNCLGCGYFLSCFDYY